MQNLIIVFIVTFVLLLYFYYQDINKEPIKRLVEAFFIGIIISLQIDWLQNQVLIFSSVAFQAFIVAGLIEEGLKLGALKLTLFRNKYFSARVDGITYAVFLSLGFATAENIILVSNFEMGIVRAFTATPAHALFAVSMGYYLGRYKFNQENKKLLFMALLVPTLLHGIYNYLIMSGNQILLFLFVPYVIYLWVKSTNKINKLNEKFKQKKRGDKIERLDKRQ